MNPHRTVAIIRPSGGAYYGLWLAMAAMWAAAAWTDTRPGYGLALHVALSLSNLALGLGCAFSYYRVSSDGIEWVTWGWRKWFVAWGDYAGWRWLSGHPSSAGIDVPPYLGSTPDHLTILTRSGSAYRVSLGGRRLDGGRVIPQPQTIKFLRAIWQYGTHTGQGWEQTLVDLEPLSPSRN